MRRKLNKLIKKKLQFLSLLFSPLTLLLRAFRIQVLEMPYFAIGHLALDIDCYLRYRELHKIKSIPILLVRYNTLVHDRPFSSEVCNQFLLNCWKRRIFTIDHWLLYFLLWPILSSDLLIYKMDRFYSTKASFTYKPGHCYAAIYSKFKKNFQPKIHFTSEESRRGKNLLAQLGLPEGAWYVCFSCREPGYYDNNVDFTKIRNAGIASYELALKEIIQRGGWCIRIGSKKSAPLSSSLKALPQIIDYPHSQFVSDFMDIFLISRCLFFLSTNSGISNVATIFGISSLMVNYLPIGQLSVFHRDINIFKLYKSNKTGELIPFKQMLECYLAYSFQDKDYEKFQISAIDNSAEEIRDAVIEMLHEMKIINTPYLEEKELQDKFLTLLNDYNISYYGSPKIGSAFLKKYSYLI